MGTIKDLVDLTSQLAEELNAIQSLSLQLQSEQAQLHEKNIQLREKNLDLKEQIINLKKQLETKNSSSSISQGKVEF